MKDLDAQMLANQMSDYLRENHRGIESGRISEVGTHEEGEESFEEEVE